MIKNNKIIVVLGIFMVLIVLLVLFVKTPIDLKNPLDTKVPVDNMPVNEPQVAGFLIQFENGTTEPEVKAILENCNMISSYNIDCNSDNGGYKYYIKVDKDNMPDVVKDGLKNDDNWTDPVLHSFTKGDYIIYPITEQATHDKDFLDILKRHNLQVKTFVWCLISYRDDITEKDAIRITNELEMNEKVWTVMPDYIDG
ncbi:MAG: UPF0228 family protein [Methanolobus sp.]|jgi:hypothetical protein|nr:UPF0228 family protein [Methanolobus sp.]